MVQTALNDHQTAKLLRMLVESISTLQTIKEIDVSIECARPTIPADDMTEIVRVLENVHCNGHAKIHSRTDELEHWYRMHVHPGYKYTTNDVILPKDEVGYVEGDGGGDDHAGRGLCTGGDLVETGGDGYDFGNWGPTTGSPPSTPPEDDCVLEFCRRVQVARASRRP